jgi:hypothetical protein
MLAQTNQLSRQQKKTRRFLPVLRVCVCLCVCMSREREREREREDMKQEKTTELSCPEK